MSTNLEPREGGPCITNYNYYLRSSLDFYTSVKHLTFLFESTGDGTDSEGYGNYRVRTKGYKSNVGICFP